jgi:exonuclease III
MMLRVRLCNINVLNVHAPSEEKNDDSILSIYKELEQLFNHLHKYHITLLLGDINAKFGREDIFKPTIGNETIHQDSKDNGVRIFNFATSKYLAVLSTIFPHETFIHTPGPLVMGRFTTRLIRY